MQPAVPRQTESGFSLIEVLVAMTILSVCAVALIGTGQQHAARLERLETLLVADTLAANRLVELRLSPSGMTEPRRVTMAGRSWRVETRLAPTSDPDLAQVDIEVYSEEGTSPLSKLTGFADTSGS